MVRLTGKGEGQAEIVEDEDLETELYGYGYSSAPTETAATHRVTGDVEVLTAAFEAALMHVEWIKDFEKIVEIGMPCIILQGCADEWEIMIATILKRAGYEPYVKMSTGVVTRDEQMPYLDIVKEPDIGIFVARSIRRRVTYIRNADTCLIDQRYSTPTELYDEVVKEISSASPGLKVVLHTYSADSLPVELTSKCVFIDVEPPSFEMISDIAKRFGIPDAEAKYLIGLPLTQVLNFISLRKAKKRIDAAELRKRVFGSISAFTKVISRPNMSWNDLGDMERIKEILETEVISIFENPGIAEKFGVKPPRILLMGPPGTGKSVLAHALGTRIPNATIVELEMSKILSKWVGESEKRFATVLNLVKMLGSAGPRSPVIFFVDEIDTAFPSRWQGGRGGESTDIHRSLLNMMLRFLENDALRLQGLIMIAATNKPSDIDAALLSRFDLKIPVLSPKTPEERRMILLKLIDILARRQGIEVDQSVLSAVWEIARRARGLVPRDFRGIVSRAIRIAFARSVREGKKKVALIGRDLMTAFEWAKPTLSMEELEREEAAAKRYSSVNV